MALGLRPSCKDSLWLLTLEACSCANKLGRSVLAEDVAANLALVDAFSDFDAEAVTDPFCSESHRVVFNRDTFHTVGHFPKSK